MNLKNMKKKLYSWLVTGLAIVLILASLVLRYLESQNPDPSPSPTPQPTQEPEPTEDPEPTKDPEPDPTEDPLAYEVYEDGIYDTKDEVAYYIYMFHKLPSNYMTKKEARTYGWENGALNQVVEGKCIGGDYFGNYEKLLPDDVDYHECDIDTMNRKSRGEKRIIYSENWDIYYTDDHYETFELLYEGE